MKMAVDARVYKSSCDFALIHWLVAWKQRYKCHDWAMLTEISLLVVFKLLKVLELLHATLIFIKQQYLDFGIVTPIIIRQTIHPEVVDQGRRPRLKIGTSGSITYVIATPYQRWQPHRYPDWGECQPGQSGTVWRKLVYVLVDQFLDQY